MASSSQTISKKRLRRHDANGEDDIVMLDHSSSWSTSSSSLVESVLGVPSHEQHPPEIPVKREIKRSRLRRHDACEANNDMTLSPQSASSLEAPKQSTTTDNWLIKDAELSPQSASSLDLPERGGENKDEIQKDDHSKTPPTNEPFFVDDWLNAIQL